MKNKCVKTVRFKWGKKSGLQAKYELKLLFKEERKIPLCTFYQNFTLKGFPILLRVRDLDGPCKLVKIKNEFFPFNNSILYYNGLFFFSYLLYLQLFIFLKIIKYHKNAEINCVYVSILHFSFHLEN